MGSFCDYSLVSMAYFDHGIVYPSTVSFEMTVHAILFVSGP